MSILNWLFGCGHKHTTWPLKRQNGTVIVCVDCGASIPCLDPSWGLEPPLLTQPVERETGIERHNREMDEIKDLRKLWDK